MATTTKPRGEQTELVPKAPPRYLVREEKQVSTIGGLVKFNLNDEITDPYLVQLAQTHGVELIPLGA